VRVCVWVCVWVWCACVVCVYVCVVYFDMGGCVCVNLYAEYKQAQHAGTARYPFEKSTVKTILWQITHYANSRISQYSFL
jgi:hypothetical protein